MSVKQIDEDRKMTCPSPERWSMLAAGFADERDSEMLLAHAASCASCAAILKESIDVLSDDESLPEMTPALESSNPEWPREMARRMARRPSRPYWLPIAAVLALAFAGSSAFWIWREQHRAPLELLAKAYAARRPVELRIQGAAWSEVRVERGNGGALQTPELLESEAAIARNITARSAAPEWLHAQGLAQLLEWKYDAAIESLKLADDLAPAGDDKGRAVILLDLSTAYYERAKANSNPLDYSLSLDTVSKALQADPALDAALFNRAIVYETEHQYFLALDDWKKYLQRDRSGPWADEARRRQSEVQKKIDAIKPTAKNRIDDLPEQQIENALAAALTNGPWEAAAVRLERDNGDRWLRDALPFAGHPAVPVLASMVDSRLHVSAARFGDELSKLTALRGQPLPTPLQAWLAYEYVFRITHSTRIAEGMPGADALVRLCESKGYWFMLAQILLERFSFEGVQGHWNAAEADVFRARELASGHHLLSEELRAMGFEDGRLVALGRYREAAVLEAEGLLRFWSRPFPYFRGQQFYADAAAADEALGRYADAAAVASTSAELARFAGSEETEAVNHARSAGFAERAGLNELKISEAARAHQIFIRIPRTPDTDSTRAFVEAQMASGRRSLETLLPFEETMRVSSKPLDAIPFLRVLSSLEAAEGKLEKAESHLRDATQKLDVSFKASDRRQWQFEADSVFRALASVLLRENRPEAALEVWDRYLSPGTTRPFHPSLTYARLGSRYVLWTEGTSGIRAEWLKGDAADIDRLARGYAALCAARWSSTQALQQVGHRLRDELRADEAGTGFSVQPDGDLSRIPWVALTGGGAGIEVCPLPSERVTKTSATMRGSAVIVAAEASPELPALPDLEREVGAVGSSMPGASVLRGPDATVEHVERALKDATFLHFTGHAVASPEGIALMVAPEKGSDDLDKAAGLLRLSRSSMPHLRSAVLSACSTGRYEEAEDSEPTGLAQRMLQAGTGEVVASLWPVDSAATTAFMVEFYRGVGRGVRSEEALSFAAHSLRSRAEFAHPYYWASFEVFRRN